MNLEQNNNLYDIQSLIFKQQDFIRELQANPSMNLEVDLGCGKGRFLLTRASKFPDTIFLGIDKRKKRIELVSKRAMKMQLNNVRLILSEINFAISTFLPPSSVSVYYLFFPDPWPKRRHSRRRLFNTKFMNAIARTLKPHGKLHLATDDENYFKEIVNVVENDKRFEPIEVFIPAEDERTHFEILFLEQNKKILRYSIVLKQ